MSTCIFAGTSSLVEVLFCLVVLWMRCLGEFASIFLRCCRDEITPAERVELRSVLPPASSVRAKVRNFAVHDTNHKQAVC